ncbi:MAG TPA: hypothetical protein VFX61_09065 [Micromonosporaceae bacterium]|nr:hypothetical protein [Micromonosporaceae bacterium]
MSHYGPPGGPHSGQPQEPWGGRQSDSYDQPSDPWGGQEALGGGHPWEGVPPSADPTAVSYSTGRAGAGHGPGYPQGGYGQPGFGPDSGAQTSPYPPAFGEFGGNSNWATLEPPPKKKSNTPLIAFIVVLAMLVIGGGGVAFYLLTQDQGKKDVTADRTDPPKPQDTEAGSSGQPTLPDETSTPSGDATGTSSAAPTSVRLVEVGQCVKNEGTNSKPKLVITECAPHTYEVLERIDGPTTGEEDAKKKCSKLSKYDNWYFFDDPLPELSFVLCLKKR